MGNLTETFYLICALFLFFSMWRENFTGPRTHTHTHTHTWAKCARVCVRVRVCCGGIMGPSLVVLQKSCYLPLWASSSRNSPLTSDGLIVFYSTFEMFSHEESSGFKMKMNLSLICLRRRSSKWKTYGRWCVLTWLCQNQTKIILSDWQNVNVITIFLFSCLLFVSRSVRLYNFTPLH